MGGQESQSGLHRLTTTWETKDPQLKEVLELISSTPEFSIERLELEAHLHMFQARVCWGRIAVMKSQQRRSRRGKSDD